MKGLVVLLLSFLVIFTGCKGENDVVATYKGGEVKRGEFYEWMESSRINLKKTLEKKSDQKKKLEQFVTVKLILKDANEKKIGENKDFLKVLPMLEGNFISKYWKTKVSKDVKFKEDAIKARQIKLSVKSYKKVDKIVKGKKTKKSVKLTDVEMEREIASQLKLGEEIIAKLNKGESFESLAKKYNSSRGKKNGGDIGFITMDQKGPEFGKHIFSLKVGEFSAKPFKFGRAIYILKAESKETLTNDNIEDIVDNEKKAKGLKRRLEHKASKKYFKDLSVSSGSKFIKENINSKDKDALIFSVADVTYKVSDLDEYIKFQSESFKKQGRKMQKVDLKFKENLVKYQYDTELIKADFKKNGSGDSEYAKKWKSFKDLSIIRFFIQDVIIAKVEVKSKEVKDFYNLNKKKYLENLKKNKGKTKNKKKFESYAKMKDRIESMLKQNKIKSIVQKYTGAILRKGNLKVLDDELEGK